ncbi:MAG: GatB/YqeY domain-containing protein, partial [Firmicutes bacterium]|nr:GatB/YqeY domain-containing protein [Bacillota bacterium]
MLREQLDAELKAALRQHDALRVSLIRQVKASIQVQETRGRRTTLDEADILAVIAKELKEREEVIPDFERGGRP